MKWCECDPVHGVLVRMCRMTHWHETTSESDRDCARIDRERCAVSAPTTPCTADRLPIEPILRQLRLMGGPFVGLTVAGYRSGTKARDRLDKALERAIDDGHLTLKAADQICCQVLGLHPVLVYGEIWWTTVFDAEEPTELGAAS
jgi:hypothetical protein